MFATLLCAVFIATVNGLASNEKNATVSDAECRERIIDADLRVQKILLMEKDTAKIVIPRNEAQLDRHYCE